MTWPRYPNATPIGSMCMSAAGGGGGDYEEWTSDDRLEQVVAFFRERLEPPTHDDGADGVAWRYIRPDGSGGDILEIRPARSAQLFSNDIPLAPEAVTIHRSALYVPPRSERRAGSTSDAAPTQEHSPALQS